MGSPRTQLVVLFMREFSWDYEYAKKTIGEMPLPELNPLVEELMFQISQDVYERAVHAAAVSATIINTTRRKNKKMYKASELVGQPPRRKGERSTKTLREAAEEIGIKIPKGGIQ